MINCEVAPDQVKQYANSFKSVAFTTEGCKISNKGGKVLFDISSENPTNVFVHLKKLGGNGHITLNGKFCIVSSRTYQSFGIEVGKNIEILRPKTANGEVLVTGFTFSSNIDARDVSINWKDLIRKCGKYGGLRLVRGQLFANPGGFIENGQAVKTIETNPLNAVSHDGEIIRFKMSCEITNMILDSNIKTQPATSELYNNRNPPTSIVVPEPNNLNKEKRPAGNIAMKSSLNKYQLPNFDDHILYDSSNLRSFKGFLTGDKRAKEINSNAIKYLVLSKNSQVKSAISSLSPNKGYICIINAKKLSGNGRMFAALSSDDKFSGEAAECVFTSNFTNKYIQIKSGAQIPNKPQMLHLTTPDKFCNGEILIKRIMIIDDLGIENARTRVEGRRYLSHADIKAPERPPAILGSLSVDKANDPVYVSAKKYALYPSIEKARSQCDVSGTIMTNSLSGIVWASRIKAVCKNVRVGDLKNEVSSDSLLISHLGHLKQAKNIWIEPFAEDADICDSDLDALQNASKIISPSKNNAAFLQLKLQDKKIIKTHLPMPWVKPDPEPFLAGKDFVLSFERDPDKMKVLFDLWNNNLPRLVIVGARGRYHDFVIPINEYYPYRKVLFLIKNAKAIIDLPKHDNYHSSIIDMANHVGTTVVSTNKFIKDYGVWIEELTKANLEGGIKEALEIVSNVKDMSDYHEHFAQVMYQLFS